MCPIDGGHGAARFVPLGKRKVTLVLRFTALPKVILRLGVAVEEGLEPAAKLLLSLCMPHPAGQVVSLARIAFQVVEFLRQFVTLPFEVFSLVGADCPHVKEIVEYRLVPLAELLAPQ